MLNIYEIIEEYRKGDFEKRLSFFLEYRDIRDAFSEIDQKEYTSGNSKERSHSKLPPVCAG